MSSDDPARPRPKRWQKSDLPSSSGDASTIKANLWNVEKREAHLPVLLEQYKLYVEMADRVSARRGASNTFFLALNSSVFILIGALWTRTSSASTWLLIPFTIVLVGQCLAWFLTVRSYRQLNAVKFQVIGALEQSLPVAPYSKAEWGAVGEGVDPSRYLPISHVEQIIPALFAVAYIAALWLALVTR